MQARIRALTQPKTEHADQTNEDALAYSAADGLFAVADGVGSATFSREWARILVTHFVYEPLLSDDPFEVEWWLRRAQRLYEEQAPKPESLPSFAQENARRGGASTLVTVRALGVEDEALAVELMAFGDSCAIVRYAGAGSLDSFPLERPEEFTIAPVSLPARSRYFDRGFHRCQRRALRLRAGDVVILATDALAKCILGAGGGGLDDPVTALGRVLDAGPEDWPGVVSEWRQAGAIADDDTTAVLIELGAEGDDVGVTREPGDALLREREIELSAALAEGRREAVAMAYGDGSHFAAGRLDDPEVQRARLVADAVADVRRAIMRNLSAGADGAALASVWDRWAPILAQEPSAAALRRSLEQLGLSVMPRET